MLSTDVSFVVSMNILLNCLVVGELGYEVDNFPHVFDDKITSNIRQIRKIGN